MQDKFTPLKGSRPEGEAQGNGILKIVRDYKKGGKLITVANGEREEADLPNGFTVIGAYEGVKESTIPTTGDTVREHAIREDDGTLVLVRDTKLLSDEETGLSAVGNGDRVRLVYLGMGAAKSGRKFANFQVSIANA